MSEEAKGVEAESSKNEIPCSSRMKMWTTMAIFYGNVTFGCAMNAYSPALTDFKNKFETDTSSVSVVFTATIACYMIGALLCSFLYKFINRQFAVVILFTGITTAMLVSPHVSTLTLFYCVGGLLGFCMGCYVTAQIVWIMEMWQSKSGPYIQAQHFCFAVGSVISPAIMSPFLTKEDDDENDLTTSTEPPYEKNTRLFIPFTIIGCLCAVTAVGQFLLFMFIKYKPPLPEHEKMLKEEDRNIKSRNWFRNQWPGWSVGRLVILSMLMAGFDQGMETCTISLFPTFGQNSALQLSEAEAANTLTGLTAAFTVGRGLATVLIFKVPSLYILVIDIGIVVVGNVILVGWGSNSLSMLWTAGILFGLGFSSLLPSFCAYMERYLEFTDTIGALMVVSGSFVGSLYPILVGHFIDDHPVVLSYPIFFSLGVIISVVFIAYWITRRSLKRGEEEALATQS